MPSRPVLPHRRFVREDTKECVLAAEVRPKQGEPWLLFFTFVPNGKVLERRRLAEFDSQWHELSDAALTALHSAAVHVRFGSSATAQRVLDARSTESKAALEQTVAELARELNDARRALDIADLQQDSLAIMLADCQTELDEARVDAATMNAEIQELYALAAENPALEQLMARLESGVAVGKDRSGAGGERT